MLFFVGDVYKIIVYVFIILLKFGKFWILIFLVLGILGEGLWFCIFDDLNFDFSLFWCFCCVLGNTLSLRILRVWGVYGYYLCVERRCECEKFLRSSMGRNLGFFVGLVVFFLDMGYYNYFWDIFVIRKIGFWIGYYR